MAGILVTTAPTTSAARVERQCHLSAFQGIPKSRFACAVPLSTSNNVILRKLSHHSAAFTVKAAAEQSTAAAVPKSSSSTQNLRTCRQCKQTFDITTNHGKACKFHPAHYGGKQSHGSHFTYLRATFDIEMSESHLIVQEYALEGSCCKEGTKVGLNAA